MLDGKNENINGIPLKRMVDRIRRFQILNRQIFASLNTHIQANETMGDVNVKHFTPPPDKHFSPTDKYFSKTDKPEAN